MDKIFINLMSLIRDGKLKQSIHLMNEYPHTLFLYDANGDTVLTRGIISLGDEDAVKLIEFLGSRNYDFNRVNCMNVKTPLFIAREYGREQTVELLNNLGGRMTSFEEALLMIAADELDALRSHMESHPELIFAHDHEGYNLLFKSVRCDNYAAALLLSQYIDIGSRVTTIRESIVTAMPRELMKHEKSQKKYFMKLKKLIADAKIRMYPEEFLDYQIYENDLPGIRNSLEAHPELAYGYYKGFSLLSTVVTNVNYIDRPYSEYSDKERQKILEALNCFLERMNYIDLPDPLGETPLFKCPVSATAVAALLTKNPDLAWKNNYGSTVLHRFLSDYMVSWDAVKLLLDAGAEINATDNEARTPLDVLDEENSTFRNDTLKTIRKKILAYGAQSGIKNKQVESIKKIDFEFKELDRHDYDAINAKCYNMSTGDISQDEVKKDYDRLVKELPNFLRSINEQFHVADEYQGTFWAFGAVYANAFVCPEYIYAVLNCLNNLKFGKKWSYHTTCELDEDNPRIIDGEFLIFDNTVYVPRDGNDYRRFLLDAKNHIS